VDKEAWLMAVVLTVETILLVLTFRRAKLIPVPTGVLAYIIYYQLIFYLVHSGTIEDLYLMSYAIGGTDTQFYFTITAYSIIFAFFFIAGYDMKLPGTFEADNAAFNSFVKGALGTTNKVAAILVPGYFVFLALGLNWSVVWSNTVYLAMTDPDQVLSLNLMPFRFALKLLFPAGLAIAGLSALNFSQGRRVTGTLFCSQWLFIVIYFVGAHQRASVVLPLIFAVIYGLLARRPNKLLLAAAVLLAVTALPLALLGRSTPPQGISSIPETIQSLAQFDATTLADEGLANLAEGIFIFAESSLLPAKFPDNYKILSLSPFPSAIDGFDKIQDAAQVRLTESAPMSGYIEALNFGPVFVAGLAFYFIIAIRLTRAVADRNGLAFLLANVFIFLAFFVLGAYPLRNGERFLLVAIGICCIVLYSTRGRGIAHQFPGMDNARIEDA
jgi:hypothetical protein